MLSKVVLIGLLAASAMSAHAQKFVEERYYKLDIKPIEGTKLDKLQVGGVWYFFWLFELTNTDKESAHEVDLQMFCLTDVLVDASAANVQTVREFNRFKNFTLPKVPTDIKEEFDITEKLHLLKRAYDLPDGAAKAAISNKVGNAHGPLVHSNEIGKLEAGASIKGMAIFKGVDPAADYIGIGVKCLENRIKNVGSDFFMEDGVQFFMHHTPGSPDPRLFGNKEIRYTPAKNAWLVIKREHIVYPE